MTATARPLAVVTGSSGGIGEVFARRLAGDHDVVLVARSADKLETVRASLATAHPQGTFEVVVADLSTADGPQVVLDAVAGRAVDLLVNNAGSGYHGDFVDEPADRVAAEVALDCSAVVVLTRAVLPGMVARRRGAVVNVASTAAFQPVPSMAVYGAAKAFVLSFSEALHVEVRRTGVKIVALCPGGTDTNFFAAAGADFMTGGRSTPEQVVDAALAALRGRRAVVVPGLRNKAGLLGYRLFPRELVARVSERVVSAG